MDRRVFTVNGTDEEYSYLDESDSSSGVLSFIKQILMEEDMEENYSMFHDSLALQHAEKSFYEVIGENYPSSSSSSSSSSIHHHPHSIESPDQSLSTNSDYSFSSSGHLCSTSTSSSAESQLSCAEYYNYNPFLLQTHSPFPSDFVFNSNSQSSINQTSQFTSTSNTGFHISRNPQAGSLDERGTFTHSLLAENTTLFPFPPEPLIKTEIEEAEHFLAESRGRRFREWEEKAEEEESRSSKQLAEYVDDSGTGLSELFDKVLLGTGLGKRNVLQNDEPNRRGNRKNRVIFNDEEIVDLRAVLMLCAQAISSDTPSTAKHLLMQIKQHSSSIGNGNQRLAYFFGNALEARLCGTGSQVYSVLSSKKISASEMIKAYLVYASACPFEKLAVMFANNSIWNLAKEAETLHIVDFGIRYGFKWPAFINRISKRPGGPPKLKITGIEVPQPGFRPEERLRETGSRLASYCKRFNVPFEFNDVSQRFETIKIEDLKITENEFVAVNCLFRFENLLDETVLKNNPRDHVLNLIKKANPNIFVHSIVNGCYDAPFFVTRFREALYHYSALFDMLDTNVTREDHARLMFEKEIFGREIMNVIACEGCERVERPETYKQWQLRIMRRGFMQLDVDQQIVKKLRGRLRDDGHNADFFLDVDGNWVLQGWKGRILHASSCWVPA